MHNLLNTSVGSLIWRPAIVCKPETTIQEVVLLMKKERIGSVVVVDSKATPVGIVTDKDLRNKVLGQNLGTNIPVKAIMTKSPITISTDTIAFEALYIMMKHNIHHLPIVDKAGKIQSVISSHDLMMLSTPHPIAFIRRIERQNSIEGLKHLFKQTPHIAATLLKSGLNMYYIGLLITEIHDHIVKKILELTRNILKQEKNLDFSENLCWLVFGSEGRQEQTLVTDQDNGIIYTDIPSEIGNYSITFGKQAVDYLLQCGYPVCEGRIMANQPDWCNSLSQWSQTLKKWITTASEKHIIWLTVVADLRPLWGDFSLAEKLYQLLLENIKRWQGILRSLAQTALINAPSNFLEWFAAKRASGGRHYLNIKLYGLGAIINGARFYALMEGIKEKNTWHRLNKLKEMNIINEQDAKDLIEAYEFMTRIRLQHQLHCLEQNKKPDNIIDLRELSPLEYRFLKDALKVVNNFQNALRDKFSLSHII